MQKSNVHIIEYLKSMSLFCLYEALPSMHYFILKNERNYIHKNLSKKDWMFPFCKLKANLSH